MDFEDVAFFLLLGQGKRLVTKTKHYLSSRKLFRKFKNPKTADMSILKGLFSFEIFSFLFAVYFTVQSINPCLKIEFLRFP